MSNENSSVLNVEEYCHKELDAFRLYTETRKINIIVTALIIFVGLVGNGLAVFVFAQKRFRTHSSSVYLLCLCISDGLFLLMHFFEDTLRTYIDVYTRPVSSSLSEHCRHLLTPSDQEHVVNSWIHSILIDANITDRSDLACGLVNYLRYFLRFVSAYVIIAFTLQRTLAIYWPFFQAKFASKTLAWSLVCMLVFIGLLSNLWVPFLFNVNEEFTYCDIERQYSSHYFIITIFYITLIMFIPIVVIFFCNSLIIYYVLQASKLRLDMMNVKKPMINKRTSNSQTSLTKLDNGKKLNLAVEEVNLLSPSCTVIMSVYPSNNYNNMNENVRRSSNQKKLRSPSGGGGGSGSNSLKTSSDTNHKITRMLLLMSFSYAILNLPYFISWCLFFYRIGFRASSMTQADKYNLFTAINLSEMFYVLNYGVHFFIYCASGKKFREQLRSAFRSK